MFSHVMVGSNDIDRSKRFYDALFASVGGKPGRTDDKGRLSYVHKGAAFMVSRPIDGQAACREHPQDPRQSTPSALWPGDMPRGPSTRSRCHWSSRTSSRTCPSHRWWLRPLVWPRAR